MRELDNNPKECLKKVILILNELKAVKVAAPCTILASPCTMSPAPCHFSHTTEGIIHEKFLWLRIAQKSFLDKKVIKITFFKPYPKPVCACNV